MKIHILLKQNQYNHNNALIELDESFFFENEVANTDTVSGAHDFFFNETNYMKLKYTPSETLTLFQTKFLGLVLSGCDIDWPPSSLDLIPQTFFYTYSYLI